MSNQKTILVCPLDWGLGHATRCIPIIHEFLSNNCRVIIGSSGKQKALLEQEFPNLTFLELKGYEVEYPTSGSMTIKMLLQLPKINNAIKEEHRWLDKIIDKHHIDLVVSDNRYGLWSNKVKSILITHQIFVKTPVGEWIIEQILKRHFDNFDEIWIPDIEGENNLSGDLSHKKSLPGRFKFIGPLSRFAKYMVSSTVLRNEKTYQEVDNFEFDFMAILSGPEPQRTIFENIILKQVENSNLKGILVRGLPDTNVISNEMKQSFNKEIASSVILPRNDDRIKIVNHLNTHDFLNYLQKSKVVISRSGYSTIMDLATLGKKAILVPTPRQTEQEYLAKYHSKKGNFLCSDLKDFDLKNQFHFVQEYNGILYNSYVNRLEPIIKKLFD